MKTTERLGGHETDTQAHLGGRVYGVVKERLTEAGPDPGAIGARRVLDVPVDDSMRGLFEAVMHLPADAARLRVTDESLGVGCELLVDGEDVRNSHLHFWANPGELSANDSADPGTGTGLVVRTYDGDGFYMTAVRKYDENYHQVQQVAELFFPELAYEVGAQG